MKTTQKTSFKVINGLHGWSATSYENVKGKDWQITTIKGSRGKINSTAIQGEKSESNGYISFSFDIFGCKRIDLISEVGKATEKAIREQHAKALILFDEHQEIKDSVQAYEVKEGQLLTSYGYMMNIDAGRKAVYKIEKKFGTPTYYAVCLDTFKLSQHQFIKNIKDKFGIGTYYKEGDVIDLDALNNAVIEAKRLQALEDRKKESEYILQQAAKEAKIEEGKKLVSIPAGAVAVIIGELKENESDLMTDYYGCSTVKKVYLAFSTHKKDLFPELRKAALNCPETKDLATAPDNFEHREKWSMGNGYYLGEHRYSGWHIQKRGCIDQETLNALYISAAEGRYFANTQIKQEAINKDGLFIQKYSEKAGVIYGETKPIKDLLKSAGCRFNMYLKIDGQTVAGWIFPLSKMDEIKSIINNN